MEAKCIKKKENCIYESLFFVNQVATAHKTPQTETHSFKKKKKETQGRSIEYHQKQQIETQRKKTNGGTELPENKG